MRHIDYFDRLDFQDYKVSLKASDVHMAVGAYRLIADQIEHRFIWASPKPVARPVAKSAIGLGMLLAEALATPCAYL